MTKLTKKNLCGAFLKILNKSKRDMQSIYQKLVNRYLLPILLIYRFIS